MPYKQRFFRFSNKEFFNILIEKNDNNIIYYNPSSVKIDKGNQTIKVLTKWVFTEKGGQGFSKNINDKETKKLIDISYSLIVYEFNYTKKAFHITNITEYSKSGALLYNEKPSKEWREIPKNSITYLLFNKVFTDYKIQK